MPDKVRWRPTKTDLSGSFNRGFLVLEVERLHHLFGQESEHLESYVDMHGLDAVPLGR